jgi:hypothetical protein
MPTKQLTPAQKGAITRKKNAAKKKAEEIKEAKRQADVSIPVQVGTEKIVDVEAEGSHAIDHMTVLDNHEAPDTNKELAEDIKERNEADLSFWNNSWTWVESNNSYGNKPEDKWFINPTAKLIGEVMYNAPTIYSACEVALIAGEHTDQLDRERIRHMDFLRDAEEADLISESLDMLTSYQGRYFEAVQRYIGLVASYDNQRNSQKPDMDRLEQAKMRKHDAGTQCRNWAARLIALKEAYHSVVTDERAYNLTYNFAPLPPQDGATPSREYGLFKWSITNTLNKVGRRLTRSIKEGKMDAEKYRIPRPWLTDEQAGHQLDADDLISDFN